ncbi:unnamed protein product [Rhizoctonia solani]|uniref:Cyclin N-terminal domain-containing protein n=1 Tax=Rhizoctonia solani TaxID=456999 RepID=A0A8H3E536_9AGAM|nr:unnamed protein product [Rhizoctonia solani]
MPAVSSYAPRGQTTRGPSRHRPQRVPVFRNDNWPPRPPAQPLPVPSFLSTPDSDTLLRALPTPSFVTPPEDPPKPSAPSKAVIAASAVPLADWFADVVWALYLGPVQSVATGGNSGLAGADKAPQPLVAFVHAVLSQTLASPQCAALGLYYLVKLPVRLGSTAVSAVPLWNVAVDAEGHTAYTSVPDRKHAARAGFVAELYGPGGEDVPYRLAALALMLGNKWLDDHTFTNKTWHEVTHLSLARLTALEQRALECFNYSLGVPNEDWRAWLGVLKEGAQSALASTPTPIPMSTLVVHTMDRLEKELEVLVGGVGAGVIDVMSAGGKGVIGDRRGSVSVSHATEMELDELEMEQVEIDIDLDDGGPVPDELRRPVKVRLGAGGEVKEEDVWAKGKDAWEKEGGKDVWKKTAKESWGEPSWRKDTWHFMEEDQDEWERAIRAAGDHHDQWPNPIGSELRNLARPRVPMYGHGGYAYPSYAYPDYRYDAIGKGAYEYPTKGVYYPAYEVVPHDYEPGIYELPHYYGHQVSVPGWQKSSGCVLG